MRGISVIHIKRLIYKLSISLIILPMIIANSPFEVSASDQAKDPEVISFEQHDLNGDTTADMALIMVDFMGQRHQVVIYDQGLDMQWSNDWRVGTDFINDVWLFQTDTGEQTKLIIRFSHSAAGFIAELFDDISGDRNVSHTISDINQVDITETPLPTVQIVAQQPWMLHESSVNFMVRMTINRPLNNVLSAAGLDISNLPTDGRPAIEQEVVDSDSDGIPDYELTLAFPEVPSTWFVFRTYLNVNKSGKLPSGFRGSFLWPYLGYAQDREGKASQVLRRPEDLSPPVQVDWEYGQIKGIAQFLPLWGFGDQWHILSARPFEKNITNELDWEVIADYDFTSDQIMDMLFRLNYHPGKTVQLGARELHLQQAQFAWHHQNTDSIKWDYKVEMAALHELPSTVVEFQDFAIYTYPYEEIPWIFTQLQDWAFATFVAAEENAYDSNEGIWEWGTLEGVWTDVSLPIESRVVHGSFEGQRKYLWGEADASPAKYYEEIREGFRGEYADLEGQVQLYFSPVDRKLHLLKALKGVWNLGDGREIRYENLSGDYINRWTLLDGGKPVKSLYVASGYLINQDTAGIQFVQAEAPPALFTTLPPRSRNEWIELGQKIDTNNPSFAPDDFAAMLQQFDGPRFSATSASLRDFRLTADGFRFALELQPGFSAEAQGE